MRGRTLINILREKEYISMEELMETLRVSDRTIRSEIKEINKDGEKNEFKIVNRRGLGYKLLIENKEVFEKYLGKLNQIGEYAAVIQKEVRILKITKLILEAKSYITIDKIADILGYSRSTTISDLDEVYKHLEKLGIRLEKKSRFGIRVVSDEIEVRKFLVKHIYKGEDVETDEELNKVFFKVKEVFVKEIIKRDINISNTSIENIFYHFKILILRIKSENFIKNDTAFDFESEAKESYKNFMDISEEVFEVISEGINIEIPRKEKSFLASQIFYKSKVFTNDNLIKEKVRKDIVEILKDLDESNNLNFLKDEGLINNLVIHLCALISRARSNTQLKNPYFEEVNIRYQEIMLITLNFINEFSKRWDIELIKDEIAFVALHFTTHFELLKQEELKDYKSIGIICDSEGGLSFLLKINLERVFKDFKIRILSYKDDLEEYDFIVTNIEINKKNKRVIKIENIFDSKEMEKGIKKIKNFLKEDRLLGEEIEVIYFKRGKGGKSVSYVDFLKGESDFLTREGVVNKGFKEEVLKREESLSTAYKNGIAAPHSINMNGIKNILSITIFDEEILWKDKGVRIVFFISVKKGNINLHKTIGKIIFRLIRDDELRNKMLEVKNIEEVKVLLNI